MHHVTRRAEERLADAAPHLLHLVKRYINLTRTSRVPGAEDDAPLFFATLYADALALVQRIEGEDAVP